MTNVAIQQAYRYLQDHINNPPTIGLILGSGLGILADEIKQASNIPYEAIPHFPTSTVQGHQGQMVIGELQGKQVIAMQGRFHYYEGYTMEQVVLPIRVMQKLGVKTLIVTNAAGGINRDFQPGDLMIIKDHINFFGDHPLIGPNDDQIGPRFPDMSQAYDPEYIQLALTIAKNLDIPVQTGTYIGVSGPSYETPAEINMFQIFGADAVGMSTVPEVITARHAQMRVLGISCISNMAAGILAEPLSHDDVIATTRQVQARFLQLIKEIIKQMPEQ